MRARRAGRLGVLIACLLLTLATACVTGKRELLLEELRSLGYETKESERGVIVFLPDVLFAFDRAELTEAGRRKVDGIAELVERLAAFDLLAVEGHADSMGSPDYNQRLSEARAQAVADALIAAGIEAGRIEVKGFGETRPIVADRLPDGRDDPEARRLNRRVETILLVP